MFAAALCVLATAAVLITAPAVLGIWHRGVSHAVPPTPKLATLSDRQLSKLLPQQGEFPSTWTVSDIKELSETFGYFRYQVSDEGLGISPVECFGVVGVASTGAFDAAEVFGHDPADPPEVADRRDVRLTIGREFESGGFDAFISLVSRCLRFSSAGAGSYAVNILEDSRPVGGPQRFRYSVTTTISGEPADATRIDYYAYARTSGLVLTGTASSGHQETFDTLFDNALCRISRRALANP
ncbi:hypothetical protein MB901379_02681 [Mycobacterium basiliense]|uniref:Uncharacterized protein n=2 Tax=Mycobacterium basiliense TaxID=2094119 RepID=A0A3S4FNG2_9MYCO|nr:hypothetical protein MB901379_02681 [Mycobacterium basiliense]